MYLDYLCPNGDGTLHLYEQSWRCNSCRSSFPITQDGIALLDSVGSAEAHAFDEQHRSYDTMDGDEIRRSVDLAARYLDLAAPSDARSITNVLDVACGKGDLTIGLAMQQQLENATIYAFDHSVVSLSALARTAEKLGRRHHLRLSAQDANALLFPHAQFDLVFGNAVLHHFLDWRAFLATAKKLLRPDGCLILSEPFVDGYSLAMIVFRMAAQISKVANKPKAPGMGHYQFIVDDIGTRIRNRENLEVLATLTDKHLFQVEEIARSAQKIGLNAEFVNYMQDEYYAFWIKDILQTYQITNPDFCAAAHKVFNDLFEYFGTAYPSLFSHFKFVILRPMH